jgi:histidyl-tRNA synthetase
MSKPQGLSGFPEYLPSQQLYFNALKNIIIHSFESVGYTPMETPAVEKVTTLLSKGGIDQEVYVVKRYQDQTAEHAELALRFDLTVPLARYVAQHYSELVFPFRRYQIAPVWRGERAQAGRYRQFYQCDIDIIGEETLSLEHDVEVLMVLKQTLLRMGLEKFEIALNHKAILIGFLQVLGIDDQHLTIRVLRIIDKKNKISRELLNAELGECITQNQVQAINKLFDLKGTHTFLLSSLKELAGDNALFLQGIKELESILALAESFDCLNVITLDLTLARGLAYYTGIIFETTLNDYPQLGSIASGGRYDNLAQNFSKKNLPGIGMSIGLSRLFAALVQKQEAVSSASPALAMIAIQERSALTTYSSLANFLRKEGIFIELYLEDKKLAHQFKYADKKKIPFIITANQEEIASGQWVLRNLALHKEERFSQESLLAFLKSCDQ